MKRSLEPEHTAEDTAHTFYSYLDNATEKFKFHHHPTISCFCHFSPPFGS